MFQFNSKIQVNILMSFLKIMDVLLFCHRVSNMHIACVTVTECVSQFLPKSIKFSGRATEPKSKVVQNTTLSILVGSLENSIIMFRT